MAQSIDEDWFLTRLRILDPEEHLKMLETAAGGIMRNATHIYALFAAEWFVRKHATGGVEGIG